MARGFNYSSNEPRMTVAWAAKYASQAASMLRDKELGIARASDGKETEPSFKKLNREIHWNGDVAKVITEKRARKLDNDERILSYHTKKDRRGRANIFLELAPNYTYKGTNSIDYVDSWVGLTDRMEEIKPV